MNLEQQLALGPGLMMMVVVLLVVEKVVLMELGLDLMMMVVVEKGVLMALGLHLMMLQFQHTNRLNIMLAWMLRPLPVPVLLTDPSYLSVLEHYCYYFSTELN